MRGLCSNRTGKIFRNLLVMLGLLAVAYVLSGFMAITGPGMLRQGAKAALLDRPTFYYQSRDQMSQLTYGRVGDEYIKVIYMQLRGTRLLVGSDLQEAPEGIACFRNREDEVIALGDFTDAGQVTLRVDLNGTVYRGEGTRKNRHVCLFQMEKGFEEKASEERMRLKEFVLPVELDWTDREGESRTVRAHYQ